MGQSDFFLNQFLMHALWNRCWHGSWRTRSSESAWPTFLERLDAYGASLLGLSNLFLADLGQHVGRQLGVFFGLLLFALELQHQVGDVAVVLQELASLERVDEMDAVHERQAAVPQPALCRRPLLAHRAGHASLLRQPSIPKSALRLRLRGNDLS